MNKLYTSLLAGSLLVGVAGAGSAATFSFNFFETAPIPNAFTYAHVSGTTYALTGVTPDTEIIFSGPAVGPFAGVPFFATLSMSIVESQGDSFNAFQQELVDSVAYTFTGTSGAFAGKTFTVTAGDGGASTGTAGILSAANGASTGGVAGSNVVNAGVPSSLFPNDVMFTSTAFATTGWTFQNYSLTLTLPTSTSFSYTPGVFPAPNNLNPFIAAITGGGVATTPTTTPEPGAVALAVGALVSFGGLRIRRRK